MKLQSPWTPRLAPIDGQAHERLSTALVEDILSGELGAGARLPAHRALAAALGLSVGTVTRAYATLQRRGLARSEKGRGMFVTAGAPRSHSRVDLSVNLPPPVLTSRMLADIIERIGTGIEADVFTAYIPAAGLPEHRLQLARTITDGRDLPVEPGQILMTTGAQHAIFVAFSSAPEGPVTLERFTYPGALSAARQLRRPLVPIRQDREGIVPEALEAALARPEPPRVLYLVPSLQNPTGVTMGESRRRAIADIARAHDLTVVEDDVYAVFAPRTLPPIARLAPERTLYVGSLAKSLAPGIRVGYLVCPPARLEAASECLQATHSMATPLTALLMQHCLAEGLHTSIARSIRAEASRRNRLARAILGESVAQTQMEALHLWLPMKTAKAREIARRAATMNILVPPPEAFMAEPAEEEAGLRLCLGNVPDAELGPALEILARLVREGASACLDEAALV